MSELIISVSGLRGILGETLTPEVAVRFAAAFSAAMPEGKIVIGRDGRTTGPMLRSAIVSALSASGRDVIDADVAATPTIGVLVRELGAVGAIAISASHNPPEYNGIKLFGGDGRVLDAESGAKIRDAYFAGTNQWATYDKIGEVSSVDDPHAAHLEKVLATVDVDAIKAKQFRVLIDSNHGAGGLLGVRLLKALGCTVEAMGHEPTGKFAHTPEPTAENLQGISADVTGRECVVGFCQDPDADRLALIDETGRYIGEECTLALCVRQAMETGRTSGPIVINGATSSMSTLIAKQHGVETFRSAVGEANVCDLMIDKKASYGGEGNGGPIDPTVGYVRDSFVGMAQTLALLARTGKPLSELADELPQLSIQKSKAGVSAERLPEVFDKLEAKFTDAEATRGDGMRLQWSDRWLLVRGSNTEPIVRMIAEAPTADEAASLCDQAAELLG
ncbi:phosphoglucosamine mutase [Rhodopirellula europaea]|uniref:Phosphoglucomutase/phosphomannomutase family protein n=1 Tax=Rhodopirellula europaea 6C TaxID=1263867 RepID=M2ALS3_9BACT|nr:phosphoglucosamine mutase [Rhodopirellula europaea]EMB18065.1 Phosphoglucomutase/phosphomannomutase family protein [Rhodopirellula europaea 6C]